MIFLTNEHIQQVLDMTTCLKADECRRKLTRSKHG